MIFGALVLVVLVLGGGIAFMMKSKGGGSSDDGMMSVPARPAEPEVPSQTLSERLEQHTNVTAVPTGPMDQPAAPEPAPEPEARELTPFELAPDLSVRSEAPIDEWDADGDASSPAAAPALGHAPESVPAPVAEPVTEPVAQPAQPTPAAPVADDAPEPLVRARVQPSAPPAAPVVRADPDDDEDEAVVTRLRVPGQRPVKAVDAAPVVAPPEPELAPDPEPVVLAAEPEPMPEPEPEPEREPEPAVAAQAEPEAVEPEPETAPEPQAIEPEPDELPAVLPSFLEAALPEPEPVPAPEATSLEDAADDPIAVFDVQGAADEATSDEPDVFASLYEAQISGDLGATAEVAEPSGVVDAEVAAADDEIEPEITTGTTPPPVQFVLEPEPEADPVDHILKALVNRAKARQVGIAEVAAELVEQANLEDRDIDEVLADLVERVDEDEEQVDPAARLEELTFFNESVPRRPGQITDYDRLDKAAKKKVIIRVLCLLVAMQEDNRLKPSDPRSEAETRHWPLARAVWPVPVGSTAESEAAAAEAGDEASDAEKKLPGRRLLRTKR